MAAGGHRMEGYVQTFTLLLPAYDHGGGLSDRGHYHGGAYLYSRRHRVAVCSALLETLGGDGSTILTTIVIRRVIVFLLRMDIVKNDPQQPGTGPFQELFCLHRHGTRAASLRMHQEHTIHYRCQNHHIRSRQDDRGVKDHQIETSLPMLYKMFQPCHA